VSLEVENIFSSWPKFPLGMCFLFCLFCSQADTSLDQRWKYL
jgi:hypothetical protein